jgi:hypothetical protein
MERLPGERVTGSRRSLAIVAAALEAYERAGKETPAPAPTGPSPWTRAGRPGAGGWRER